VWSCMSFALYIIISLASRRLYDSTLLYFRVIINLSTTEPDNEHHG
jgi:hypothetical protein